MRGPNTTGVEFLESGAGREFAVSLIRCYAEAAQEQRSQRGCREESKERRFERLLDDFTIVLTQNGIVFVDDAFRNALAGIYRDRYDELYPENDEPRACAFYLSLALVGKVLAQLSVNVWKLHTGAIGGYPKPKRDAAYGLLHLQWAREAFGWWAASLARLDYELIDDPPCKPCDPVSVALRGHALTAGVAAVKPNEMENGCPVC